MIYIVLFLLGSGLLTWACVHAGMSGWLALPVFLVFYALMHLIYLLVFYLPSLNTPMDKPIEKQNPISRAGCRGVGRFLCIYGGVKPRLLGLEKLPEDQRFLFVCNHRSMFDPLMAIGYLDKYNISFISKPSNMKIPFVGRIAYATGYLPIDRENDRKALKTILTAADYLEKDICSVGIYPEGMRSKTGSMLPFHPGSFKIAQKAGVPLVIASISGSEKVKRNLFLRPTNVDLSILDVVPADKVKEMSTNELADYSRGLIERSLPKAVKEAV